MILGPLIQKLKNSAFSRYFGGIGDVLKNISADGTFDSLLARYTGRELTGAEREANQFSASQAELQRQFQEDMYLKYQSPGAMMRQYAEAGLNPALMYGGASGQNMSTSVASPSSVSPSGSLDLADAIISMVMAKAQVANIESQTRQNDAATANLEAQTDRTKMLTSAEYDEILSKIDYNRAGVSKYEAETALAFANVGLLEIDAKTRQQYNETLIELDKARAAASNAERMKIYAEVDNLKREYVISFAREAQIKANTNLLSQQELNAMVENDILSWNSKSAEFEANIKQFEDDKKASNRVWRLIGEGAGILKDVGIGVGAAVAGAGRAAGAAAGEAAKSVLWKPGSFR